MSKVTLTGTGYWINTKEYKEWPRPDGKTDKQWSMVLAPDKKSMETILELQMKGLKNRLKKNDKGEITVSFGRKVEKMIKGAIRTFNPPELFNEAGELSPELKVGNGSEVEVYLDVYEHNVPGSKNKAVAARWDGVKVLKLVPMPDKPLDKPSDTTEAIW